MAQLLAASLGLETAINAALTTASLPVLRDMVEAHEDPKTGRNAWPRCVVTLSGERARQAEGIGNHTVTSEALDVLFAVQMDGSEAEALAYEGVVAGTLRAARATVKAAVTDAQIDSWELAPGSLQRDTERKNARVAWTITIPVAVAMQW